MKGITNMPYNKNQSTKRFSFGITRNSTSHKAGANVVTIATNPEESSKYSTGTTQISMTVKEARVLQTFLNDAFSSEDSSVG
tara:strand:- start:2183 stop:2428 length:246 start_codon:yes stop_codon:yes gene_type:complete